MKTMLPEVALSVGLLAVALCAGCGSSQVNAQEAPKAQDPVPAVLEAASAPKPVEASPSAAPPGSIIITNQLSQPGGENPAKEAASISKPAANSVAEVVPPADLKLSPALAEVIKLVQAGVGEEVLMAYITNSTEIFDIGSNEILYLHDLGVPGPIITTLIQRDASPEIVARKQAAASTKPLPPGVGLTAPATNIYPPTIKTQPPETPVAETAATSAPPTAPENPAPAVVYTVPAVQEPVTVNHFYTELAPYGTWIDLPGHGRCWRPTIAVWNSSWRPYADGGRWLWTDRGWYWYSDYSWGWAPFHYGRWTTHHGVGWVWVPDVHWGPAWVSWRHSRSHCGWAPLPPSARWIAGRGFYHNTFSVGIDFDFGLSDHHYVFVPTSRFCDRRPSNYYVTPHHARAIHRESVVANNYEAANHTVVNKGVGFERVAAVNRGAIRQVSIRPTAEAPRGTLRRELLDTEGRTLTVARPKPASATPAITPPSRPVSSLSHLNPSSPRPAPAASNQRYVPPVNVRGTPPPVSTPASTENNPTRPPGSIVIRGNGRAGGSSGPAADAPVVGPSSGTIAGRNTTREPAPAPQIEAPRGGGRYVPPVSTRAAAPPTVVRPAAPAAPSPAPAPRVQVPAARPEPARAVVVPPASVRGPAPSAPVVVPRTAPSIPSPSPRPSPPASAPAPRAERYVAPVVRSTPAATAPSPSRSSGGSRSSGEDGRRGSR